MPARIPVIRHPDDFPTHSAILAGAPQTDDVYGISLHIDADWVYTAYTRGMFPWYSVGQPVLWHSPNPRMVLAVDDFRCAHSLKKRLKQWARQPNSPMKITINRDFEAVISRCASTPRVNQGGTWITDELKAAYIELHRRRQAISVEVWQDDVLVAGLYGVLIGQMFFGESMFTAITDGSKAALACWVDALKAQGGQLMDCQQVTHHLSSLGGTPISRESFFERSGRLMQQPPIDWDAISGLNNLLDNYRAQATP